MGIKNLLSGDDEKSGREDGKANIPPAESRAPSPYEQRLRVEAEGDLEKVYKKHNPAIQKSEAERATAFAVATGLVTRLETYSRQCNDILEAENREVGIRVGRKLYVTLLVVFFISEILINQQAFLLVAQNDPLAYVLALAVTLAIPTLAHFVGAQVRHFGRPYVANALGLLILILAFLGVLYGLNFLREEYFRKIDPASSHAGMFGVALALLNTFIFVVATLVSVSAHDKDPIVDRAHKLSQKLRAPGERAVARLHQLAGDADTLYGALEQEYDSVDKRYQERIFAYRQANLRERILPAPQFFQDAPVALARPVHTDQHHPPAAGEIEELSRRFGAAQR